MSIITNEWTYNDLPIVIADPERYPAAARKANSWMQPVGPECGRGWVLMTKADVLACKHSSSNDTYTLFQPKTLKVVSTVPDGSGKPVQKTLTVQNAIILSAKVVSKGQDNEHTIMLVELVDELYFFDKFSYRSGAHNVRTVGVNADYDSNADEDYYERGRVKTWDELAEFLWDRCTLSGARTFGTVNSWPSLPFTPTLPYPQNFNAHGINAYRGLYALLRSICCTMSRDLSASWDFSCVRLGHVQTGLSTVESDWDHLRTWEDETIMNGHAMSGHYTEVVFPWECGYNVPTYVIGDGVGSTTDQPTVEQAGLQGLWSTTISVAVTSSPTSAQFAVDNADSISAKYGTTNLFDAMPHANLLGMSSATPGTGGTSPRVRANEVGKHNWDMNHWPLPDRTVYAGILPDFRTGSEVRAIIWRNYGPDRGNDGGPKTEVIKYPGWPKPIYSPSGWREEPYYDYHAIQEWPGPPDFLRTNAATQLTPPFAIVENVYSWSDSTDTNDGVTYFDVDDLYGTTTAGQFVRVQFLPITEDHYWGLAACDNYAPVAGKTYGIRTVFGYHANYGPHPDGSGRQIPIYYTAGHHVGRLKEVVTDVVTANGLVTSVTKNSIGTIWAGPNPL